MSLRVSLKLAYRRAMRGTLREKRPGYWELRVQSGRDPLTGQHGQASRTFRGSRLEAEKALAAFYVEVVA